MKIVGIDPGLTGYICFLEHLSLNSVVVFNPMPVKKKGGKKCLDPVRMADIMRFLKQNNPSIKVVIEKQLAFRGQGAQSSCTTCYGYGLWIGILETLGIPYVEVTPKQWQKSLFVGVAGNTPKEKSVKIAQRYFPEVDLRVVGGEVDFHGKADALNIAYWGTLQREGIK